MRGLGIALAAALALGLAGCGGGGGSSPTAADDEPPMEMETAQEMCEADGGRWNADDEECTSAMDLAEERKATTKTANTKLKAINDEGAQTDDAGLGGTGTPATGAGVYTLGIDWDEDETAPTITLTVEGATDDDDEDFVNAGDLTHTVEGHMGRMLTRTMDPDDGNVMQEIAVVYTDIEAPMDESFADMADKVTGLDWVADTSTLTIDTAQSSSLANEFEETFGDPAKEAASTETWAAEAEIEGSFRGAPGTFKCHDSAACTVTHGAQDGITAFSAGWSFEPADGAMIAVADPDYLHYGFWLKKTTDADGAVTYNEVETFAGSSIETVTAINSLRGMATYTGGAAGVYVKHDAFDTETGEVLRSSAGRFTADAELTAYFDQTEDDPATTDVDESGQLRGNQLWTLEGTIDGFMLDGVSDDGAWSVALKGGMGDAGADTHPSGTADGGGAAGSFAGTFHTLPGGTDPHPSTLIGEFNANFNNGAVAGAFGARKDDE